MDADTVKYIIIKENEKQFIAAIQDDMSYKKIASIFDNKQGEELVRHANMGTESNQRLTRSSLYGVTTVDKE